MTQIRYKVVENGLFELHKKVISPADSEFAFNDYSLGIETLIGRNNENIHHYNTITREDIENAMQQITENSTVTQDRQFRIYTGPEGIQQFNNAMHDHVEQFNMAVHNYTVGIDPVITSAREVIMDLSSNEPIRYVSDIPLNETEIPIGIMDRINRMNAPGGEIALEEISEVEMLRRLDELSNE